MKLLVSIIAIFYTILHIVVIADEDCMTKAKEITVNKTQCCTFPDLFDYKIINDTIDKIKASGIAQVSTPLFDCLVEQTIFKDLKLIDENGNYLNDKIIALIDETIKEKPWNKIVKAAYNKCLVESLKYAEEYQKIKNIPKEKCDCKFDSLRDCVDIASFSQCPKASWTTDEKLMKPCSFLKNFIKVCVKDIAAMNEFHDHQED